MGTASGFRLPAFRCLSLRLGQWSVLAILRQYQKKIRCAVLQVGGGVVVLMFRGSLESIEEATAESLSVTATTMHYASMNG